MLQAKKKKKHGSSTGGRAHTGQVRTYYSVINRWEPTYIPRRHDETYSPQVALVYQGTMWVAYRSITKKERKKSLECFGQEIKFTY